MPPLRVREADGSPDVIPVWDISVTNTTLTDNGGGSVDLNTVGGGTGSTSTVTTTYTITTSDRYIFADASGGAFTITLPTAASSSGLKFTIKKIDSSANAVTVDGDGAETIDSAANYALTVQFESIDVVSDGTEWHIA